MRPVALTVVATASLAAVASRGADPVPPRTLALVRADPVAEAHEATAFALAQMDNSCGTPLGYARADLMVLGELATGSLAPLLDHGDAETAAFFAELLVDTGDVRPVLAWCAGRDLPRDPPARNLCKRALERMAGVSAISATGVWRGETLRVGQGRKDAVPFELRVRKTERGLAAEVCIGAGCVDAELTRQVAGRLVVRYRHRGVPTVLNLRLASWDLELEPEAIIGFATTVGCDDLASEWLCRRYVELWRHPRPR